MTLTPQDVANKEFLTVRLREGYDMQEVDQFLDDVEAELRRLYEENEQLRAGLVPDRPDVAEGEPGGSAEALDVEAARQAADEARVSDAELAQAASRAADAPAAALTILTHAQTAADNLVNEAQARADQLITDATAKSDALVGDATERAEQLDAETEQRKVELMGDLVRQETELRARLDDLRAHEREYRSRLVAYHSEQVRRLQEGQADDVDVEQPVDVDKLGAPEPDADLDDPQP